MYRTITLGGCALLLALTGCMPRQQGQGDAEGYAQNQQAYNQPVNPNQPAPYLQPGQNGNNTPSPWPGATGGQDGNMTNFGPSDQAPGGGMPPVQGPLQGPGATPYSNTGSQPLRLNGAPAGMQALKSQAGYVFRTSLGGNAPVQQQSRDFYMKLMPYFDAQPQVMGYLDDPSGRMSQVGFQATKNGAPVMGMMTVAQSANGGVVATVMLDSPQSFQQSMQSMMAAAQQP